MARDSRLLSNDPFDELRVTVLSGNAETLDALVEYLGGVGMNVAGMSAVADTRTRVTHAYVIFFDDFPLDEVTRLVDETSRQRRGPLVLLVTAQATSVAERFRMHARPNPPIVLPRPVRGYLVLDALHQERSRRSSP